jgi:hypothetical protein
MMVLLDRLRQRERELPRLFSRNHNRATIARAGNFSHDPRVFHVVAINIGRSLVGALSLVAVLLGCSCSTGGSKPSPGEQNVVSSAEAGGSRPVSLGADDGSCPVTIPNGNTPPGEATEVQSHGNGKLWTVLWPYGVMIADTDSVQSSGWIGMKFPWWAKGLEGELTISGRRLDQDAPPVRVQGPNESPPDEFRKHRFWSSGVLFESEGCWEVTGRVGATSLTVVVIVVLRAVSA